MFYITYRPLRASTKLTNFILSILEAIQRQLLDGI